MICLKDRKRQNIYWERTAPLLDYYSSKGLLKSIDGLGDIDEITKRIINELNDMIKIELLGELVLGKDSKWFFFRM